MRFTIPVRPAPDWGRQNGTWRAQGKFETELLPYLDGFHFHTLCEQNSDALETTLAALEEKFETICRALNGLTWEGAIISPGKIMTGRG